MDVQKIAQEYRAKFGLDKPVWLQYLMKTISPMPHFVEFSKNVLFRGADLPIVWPQMAAVAAMGAIYFGFTLRRFRRVIFESG